MTLPARRSRALALLLAAAHACGPHGGSVPAPAHGASIDVAAYARLLQMEDARRLDTALVRASLESGRPAERAEAVRALGRLHGEAMASTLRSLLADGDTAVAASAAFALGLWHDSAGVAALEPAIGATPAVATMAAWSLGEIGAPAAAVIRRALGTPHPSVVTRALLLAAAKLRPVPVADVRPFFQSTNDTLRWAAVYAVSRSPVGAAVRDVARLAGDPSSLVRQQVARAM
ncbi:MAG TPA: HEAT repeat domain-containing protein, partial [Gemmatimonadaceae bacterium]|nr:HEAT repeat domain-containing protein [Gemmatimonadaceae bacterium]